MELAGTKGSLEATRREKAALEGTQAAAEARAKELDRALREHEKKSVAAARTAATKDAGRAVLEKRAVTSSSEATAALSTSVLRRPKRDSAPPKGS
jgi:hypothetical protein